MAEVLLKSPRRLHIQLADGVHLRGELTGWSHNGISGSFGPREWRDIASADAWRLLRALMHDADLEESAAAWVCAGRIMLDVPGAADEAHIAFRRALRLDETIQPLIDQARAEINRIQQQRLDEQAARDAEKLSTESPEAKQWGTSPWPELDAEQHRAALATMRSDADDILNRAGRAVNPVETDYFLFYSDMPRRETARWALELDKMYRVLARTFSLEENRNIFWGKAVIFVFNDRDTFVQVERDVFHQLVANNTHGLCHPIGPKVFVNFYRQPDDRDFAAILVHETAHGFIHRFQTPRRLPTWANEGFADYLAATSFRTSRRGEDLRAVARDFIRAGGDVNRILDMEYESLLKRAGEDASPAWPGPNAIGYAVGYLLVDLMIRDRPQRFGDWVKAIKTGKDWEVALEEDFGVPRHRLVQTFQQFYRVND